jgi:hypothetical protein
MLNQHIIKVIRSREKGELHPDPCCCKWGCDCRKLDGTCRVCLAKHEKLHTKFRELKARRKS